MKDTKYIADLSLRELPELLIRQLKYKNWDKLEPNKRLNEISYCITEIYMRLEHETNSYVRKDLCNQLRILKRFQNMKLTCPYVYLLVSSDVLELPIYVADSIDELSAKLGLSSIGCYKALERNSVLLGKYRIRKVNIVELQDKFNFLGYKEFCLENGYSQCNAKSLARFKEYCSGA